MDSLWTVYVVYNVFIKTCIHQRKGYYDFGREYRFFYAIFKNEILASSNIILMK